MMNARTQHHIHHIHTPGVIAFGIILFLVENFDPKNRINRESERVCVQNHFTHIQTFTNVQTNHHHCRRRRTQIV